MYVARRRAERRKVTCPCRVTSAGCARSALLRGRAARGRAPRVGGRRRASAAGDLLACMEELCERSRAATPARACTAAGWARRARTSCCWCAKGHPGRHNAMDKLVGQAWLDRVDVRDKRCSRGASAARWPLKAYRAGCPVLVSHWSATDEAVRRAEELGVTLASHCRDGRIASVAFRARHGVGSAPANDPSGFAVHAPGFAVRLDHARQFALNCPDGARRVGAPGRRASFETFRACTARSGRDGARRAAGGAARRGGGGGSAISPALAAAGSRAVRAVEREPLPAVERAYDAPADEPAENPIDTGRCAGKAPASTRGSTCRTRTSPSRAPAAGDDFFYTDHDRYGEPAVEGAVFSQMANATDFSSPNHRAVRHNIVNDAMFARCMPTRTRRSSPLAGCTFTCPIASSPTRWWRPYEYDDRHILNSFDFSDPPCGQATSHRCSRPTTEGERARRRAARCRHCVVQLSACRSA